MEAAAPERRFIPEPRSTGRAIVACALVASLLGIAMGTAFATPVAPGTAPVITASGRGLLLGEQPYRALGYNADELATDWGVNAGCGGMLSDSQLNAFFVSLPPNSLVRFWVMPGAVDLR